MGDCSTRASSTWRHQGFIYRPDRPNRRGPVPVYRSGLAGNWSVPVKFKFEFKKLSSTGSYRYTGRLDRFTGRFDRFEFKSKFKIACNRFGTVYRPVWPVYRPVWLVYQVGLNGPSHFFLFLFCFNFKCPKSMLNERIFQKIWHH